MGPTLFLSDADAEHLNPNKVSTRYLAGRKCSVKPAVVFSHYNQTSLLLPAALMDQPLTYKEVGLKVA